MACLRLPPSPSASTEIIVIPAFFFDVVFVAEAEVEDGWEEDEVPALFDTFVLLEAPLVLGVFIVFFAVAAAEDNSGFHPACTITSFCSLSTHSPSTTIPLSTELVLLAMVSTIELISSTKPAVLPSLSVCSI